MPGTPLSVNTHNLGHYVNLGCDQTHAVRALIKQLNSVTEDIDPEHGFAKSLSGLSWRLQNSGSILKAELHHQQQHADHGVKSLPKHPPHDAHVPKVDVAKSSAQFHLIFGSLFRRKSYNEFL